MLEEHRCTKLGHCWFRFAPQMVPGQTTTYGYVSEAQLYGGNVQYAQPVQLVTVSQSSWGWSDLALLAIASGMVGLALGSRSQGHQQTESAAGDAIIIRCDRKSICAAVDFKVGARRLGVAGLGRGRARAAGRG